MEQRLVGRRPRLPSAGMATPVGAGASAPDGAEPGPPAPVRRMGPVVTTVLDVALAALAAATGLLLGWPEFGTQGNLTVWYGAIAVGALMVVPARRWWPYLVALVAATYFASIQGGWSPMGPWVRAICDLLVVVALAVVLGRLRCIPFRTTRDAIIFLLVVDVAGGIRSLVGPGLAVVTAFSRGGQALPSINVGLSTVIGCVAVVPLIVLVVDRRTWPPFTRRDLQVAAAAVAGMAALVGATYFEPPGLLYLGLGFLVIPAFVVLAIRFSQVAVATALLITVSGIAAGTAHGWGPFALRLDYPAAAAHVILTVQLFLVALPSGTWILAAAIAESRRSLGILQAQVDVDAITGLRSRRWLTTRLEERLREEDGVPAVVAVLFVDLLQFEAVRHSLGYGAGDEVVAQIAAEVEALVPAGGELGRFSGDRLLMVVPGMDGTVELSELADRIVEVVSAEREVRGKRMARDGFVGAAVGAPGATAETLLRDADLALATAETASERGWKIFDQTDADEGQLLAVEHAIRVGLERDEFVAYFQPQVQMYDGTVCGYEALVRWIHPDRGLVPPIEFIPAAERTGLIVPLGHVVLQQACNLLVARPDIPAVSVNVSPVQLAHEEWLASVKQVLRSSGVEPGRLVVELTETAVFRLTELARGALVELHDLGVGVHVDDFGTGFSSLTNLRDLPVTGLKLDRSFVIALGDGDDGALALVRGLAGLANGLGLETVAEGVETEEQATILLEAGWTLAQGYLYGRPEPAVVRAVEGVDPDRSADGATPGGAPRSAPGQRRATSSAN